MFWLLACACPRFEEMVVTDPDGLATPEMVSAVESAIADFASWTTVEGVCVPEVTFREVLEEAERRGAYFGSHDPIQLLPLEPAGAYTVAVHELCHAWDGAAGEPSAGHPELFDLDPGEADELAFETFASELAEGFALACEDGVEGARVEALLAERCPDVTLPGAWLLENVFDADAATAIDETPRAIGRDPVPLQGAPTWWPYATSPAGVWGRVDGDITLWGEGGEPVATWEEPADGWGRSWGLFAGDGGVAWLAKDDAEIELWTMPEGTSAFAGPTMLPRRADATHLFGATTVDRAWLFEVGDRETTWWAVALDGSGVVEEGALRGRVDEAAAVGSDVWVLLDGWLLARAAGAWEARLPFPHAPRAHGLAPLPDGGWVVPVFASGVEDTDVVRTLARFDGARWSFPPDPCGADARIAASEVRGAGGRAALVEHETELDEVRYAPLSW